jgi:hypothetical protein
LKLARVPLSLVATLATLPSISEIPFLDCSIATIVVAAALCTVCHACRAVASTTAGDDKTMQRCNNLTNHERYIAEKVCCNFCKALFLKAKFMPSLIRKVFHKSEAPKDGLTQPQREAIVDLLNYCMYADNLVFLAEDRLITDTVAKFNWDPKVPFDQFDARSVSNARDASESQVYRDQFLASIKDRLDTAAVKGQALDLCQELFLADGARSDEEDVVLQHLRELLE